MSIGLRTPTQEWENFKEIVLDPIGLDQRMMAYQKEAFWAGFISMFKQAEIMGESISEEDAAAHLRVISDEIQTKIEENLLQIERMMAPGKFREIVEREMRKMGKNN